MGFPAAFFVKVGDVLYVVPSDTRQTPWNFIVGKIGRSYIVDNNGQDKIELNTYKIYHKDGIGCDEHVFINKEKYEVWKKHQDKCKYFSLKIRESGHLFFKMSDEDMETITKIMCKYDEKWLRWYEK